MEIVRVWVGFRGWNMDGDVLM